MDLKEIANHYLSVIVPSESYNIHSPCRDTDLLYPPFKEKIDSLIEDFREYSEDELYILETYRSNTLQQIYFRRGASKIQTNGMHHYGVAVDLVRGVGGRYQDYQLDYKTLRHLAKVKDIYVLEWEDAHFQYVPVFEQGHLRIVVKNTVVEFQKENGLVPDGIVGNKTINKAKEVYL